MDRLSDHVMVGSSLFSFSLAVNKKEDRGWDRKSCSAPSMLVVLSSHRNLDHEASHGFMQLEILLGALGV